MSAFEAITCVKGELAAIRQDLHAHPELGMEEHRTAEIVARKLEEWGIEVHRGVGGTGVVGVLRSGNGEQAIGLRADMDALPMEEANDLPYRSTAGGRMHACGHDGHTTMLLGAARYLAETRAFNGTVNFIFQPGEEGCGGALAMLKDGLFERFPCNQIFAMHNRPGLPVGQYAIRSGPTAAGGAFFDITVEGKGSHGARPEAGIDPVLAACHITAALQSIVSRTVSPMDTAVVSVTKISGGDAYNIIPQFATISGTARFFSDKARVQIETGLQRVAEGVAAGFGATARLDFRLIFAPTINAPEQTERFAAAAAELVGEDKVTRTNQPGMGSEDFSFMMQQVPGAYLHVGNGDSASVHNQHYNFNDEAIPYGAALLARVVERELPRGQVG
ncbi:MAG: amidohydrolase [Acetobacteraceae bacterium]|nr:MAG: amidohydrolase [Acetobacteraceae bacterium]